MQSHMLVDIYNVAISGVVKYRIKRVGMGIIPALPIDHGRYALSNIASIIMKLTIVWK